MATFEERFLERLARLAGGPGITVSNNTLRAELGWKPERYEKTRRAVLKTKNIKAAQAGPGGGVSLIAAVPPQVQKSIKVFISYSHVDEKLKDQLLKHLGPLKRLGIIDEWHDRKIKAGDTWGEEISANLQSADIIILLVSVDFINSEYCYEKEFEVALKRHDEGSAVIVPVIGRSCMWTDLPFGAIHGLPKDAKAVATWDDQDEALTDVARGIRDLACRLRESPAS
ncbi:toll/interleukin-1 receptor domain-containing protein [Phenylobacterium sp.]|uniref:toll/interleukin-1 receptor domain-containing protein n=1 Tax=Phenylobacterium sp. TaxID=1871053 RepID=UPI002715AEBA|nr:toll/interleukin-1 receptor domain-containing protein [Phenylobacterium sp.]MDO8798957.1 toll/interleukin-1 receptor domain-containing protein [Phenylobacterium sp.]